MTLLGREQILGAQDYKFEDVACPEWGGEVRIRSMGGKASDVFDMEVSRLRKSHGEDALISRELVVSLCAIDDQGNLLFHNPMDVVELGKKSPEALQRCYDAALQLSGKTKKAQEEIEKN